MAYQRRFAPFLALGAALAVLTAEAAAHAEKLLDPKTQPRFENKLPDLLHGDFVFHDQGDAYYEIAVQQFTQDVGLRDPQSGEPLLTTLWGYGTRDQPPVFPGRTFLVHRDNPITVSWQNKLMRPDGMPLPHLLPVDTSIHWADPLYCHVTSNPACGPTYTGPVPLVMHLHGGHTDPLSDGFPEAWFTPGHRHVGPAWTPQMLSYNYANDQEAAALWYHDHTHGITRLNMYAGLSGMYIIRDDRDTGARDNPLHLPAHPYEVPLMLQDRTFTENGQLSYPHDPPCNGAPDPSIEPEYYGEFMLVNGKTWPVLDVEPRKYRFRLLDASDSRFYGLSLVPQDGKGEPLTFHQIGGDNGLLSAPVELDHLLVAPAERADLIVDFSDQQGKTILLTNDARAPYPEGDEPDPATSGRIMAFRVVLPLNPEVPDTPLPGTLRPSPFHVEGEVKQVRTLLLAEGEDGFGRVKPALGTASDGTLMWDDPATEVLIEDDTEEWEFYNTTDDAHPIHVHLVSFEVLERRPFTATQNAVTGALSGIELGAPEEPLPNERGPKDTVLVYPGQVTRIRLRFDKPGRYVWHCHIVSHEDNDMMRPIEVLPR
jgi:spore coat protein A